MIADVCFQNWLWQFVGDPVNQSHPLYPVACQLFTIYEFLASLLDEEAALSAGELLLSSLEQEASSCFILACGGLAQDHHGRH